MRDAKSCLCHALTTSVGVNIILGTKTTENSIIVLKNLHPKCIVGFTFLVLGMTMARLLVQIRISEKLNRGAKSMQLM